jgi:hypothetical protein
MANDRFWRSEHMYGLRVLADCRNRIVANVLCGS